MSLNLTLSYALLLKELIEKIIQLPCIDGVHLMGPNCEKGSARIISHFR